MRPIATYRNGNYDVVIYNNGTKVRIIDENDEFEPVFPENIDMKITNKCPFGCPYCHEKSTPDGKIANLAKWTTFIKSLKPGTELALGGGAISSIPREIFKKFLREIPPRVIVNVTVNQREIDNDDFLNFLLELRDNLLINAIGVSYYGKSKNLERLITLQRKFVVVHTINGLLTEEDIKYLSTLDCKILILGYKKFGRGNEYSKKFNKIIKNNQKYLDDNINSLKNNFRTMSFDNLAVEQLNIKSKVLTDTWQKLYMGDDGSFTMYVDLVNGTYGANSTTPVKDRFKLNVSDTVESIFEKIKEK